MTVRFHREKRSWIILNFSSPAWTLICKSILMQLAVCSELYSASRDSSAWYSRAHSVGWCFQTSIWQARRDSARNDTWNIAWLARRDRALQVAARLSTFAATKITRRRCNKHKTDTGRIIAACCAARVHVGGWCTGKIVAWTIVPFIFCPDCARLGRRRGGIISLE